MNRNDQMNRNDHVRVEGVGGPGCSNFGTEADDAISPTPQVARDDKAARRQRLSDHGEEMLHFLGLIADQISEGMTVVIRRNSFMGRNICRLVETLDGGPL